MEEIKYYQPEIEEFHVGFECEIKNSSGNVFEWEKFKIIGVDDAEISGNIMDWSFYDSSTAIKEETVRVKCLDQEDIESFGFILTKEYSDETVFQKQLDNYSFWEIGLQEDGFTSVELFYQIKMVGKIQPKDTWEHSMKFLGKIKNKSELKRLLKQLEII